MNNPTPTPISQRAFAKIIGVSPPAVGKAVKTGRLKESLVWEGGVAKIGDVDLARREFQNADRTKAPAAVKEAAEQRATNPPAAPGRRPPAAPPSAPPPPPGGDEPPKDLSLTDETAREKFWKANLAELDFRKRSSELVEAEEMVTAVADAFARVRAKLQGIPTRARQQLPHLTSDDVVVLDGLVRESLEDLTVELEAAAPPVEEAQGAGAPAA